MAFERRQGGFTLQTSEQLVTMVLYCTEPGCNKSLMSKLHLEQHLQESHNIRRFRCLWPECGESFENYEPLGQHVRRRHYRGVWKCPHTPCTKAFRSHNKLHRHIYHHHSGGLFRCAHPGCSFGPKPSRNTVYSHYRREHIPKTFNDPFPEATEAEVERNNPCAICIRPMTRFSTNRRLPSCTHAFHLRCLLRWMRTTRTCPSCRTAITVTT